MYSEKVMDHFEHPRNVGEIENASGVGTVGNAKCGDIMRIYLDIDEEGIIRDVKFKTFGCGAAVATSSMATELVKGKSIQEAMEVTNKAVMEALDGLPPVKVHCSLLAEEAIHAALWDYAQKHGITIEGLEKPKSDIHEGEEEAEEESRLKGVSMKTRIDASNQIKETRITIKDKEGEQVLGKPMGQYITIEAKDLSANDGSYHKEMSEALYLNLKEMIPRNAKVFVAGLGNSEVTADSLGPKVVNNLWITRHLKREGYLKDAMELSAIAPGVMAQTGIETSEVLEALAAKIQPDLLIAVDALAARSSSRLNKTIQISDTGIAPGSGVGNHRNEITERTVGIPVLAIGVPTVISVPAIISDIVGNESDNGDILEMLDEDFTSMHVTPKNIDESIKRISYTISEGINHLLHNHIKAE